MLALVASVAFFNTSARIQLVSAVGVTLTMLTFLFVGDPVLA